MTTSIPTTSGTQSNWKNVNNWHWLEKDCTSWAHECLKMYLANVSAEPAGHEGPVVRVSKVREVKGEVSVNQRKGKVKALYDLRIVLELVLSPSPVDPAEESSDGQSTITIDDYTWDSDFKDLDYRARLCGEMEGAKAVVYDELKKKIWEQLQAFKKQLDEVHGNSLLVSSSPPATMPDQSSNAGFAAEQPSNNSRPAKNSAELDISAGHFATETLTMTVSFSAPPAEIYSVLTDISKVRAWSRSQTSTLSPVAEGTFSLFNNNITGKFESLDPPTSLSFAWRNSQWPAGHYSKVRIDLKEDCGGSRAELRQERVPAHDIEATRNNWTQYYWNPIKAVFGFGGLEL